MGLLVAILLVFVSIFCPPLAVLLHSGCTIDLLINVILTLFGWLPGVIHAIIVIFFLERERDRGLI